MLLFGDVRQFRCWGKLALHPAPHTCRFLWVQPRNALFEAQEWVRGKGWSARQNADSFHPRIRFFAKMSIFDKRSYILPTFQKRQNFLCDRAQLGNLDVHVAGKIVRGGGESVWCDGGGKFGSGDETRASRRFRPLWCGVCGVDARRYADHRRAQ